MPVIFITCSFLRTQIVPSSILRGTARERSSGRSSEIKFPFVCFQFAGLDLQSRSSSGRYVPPHLRNKQSGSGSGSSAEPGGYEKERDRGESRGGGGGGRGYSRNTGGGGGGGGGGGRSGDFSNFNTRGRRDQNGDDDWGRNGGSRNQERYEFHRNFQLKYCKSPQSPRESFRKNGFKRPGAMHCQC